MVCDGVWKVLPDNKQSGFQEIRRMRLVAPDSWLWLSLQILTYVIISQSICTNCVIYAFKSANIEVIPEHVSYRLQIPVSINYDIFMVCFPVKPLKKILFSEIPHEGAII